MRKPSKLYIALGVLCGGLFFIGLGHLFMLRFQTGDIYPPYSSLRADPLGTKALYQSLANTGRVEVRRHYESIARLPSGNDTTLFYLGSSGAFFYPGTNCSDGGLNKEFRRIASTGGRVVISFNPPAHKVHQGHNDNAAKTNRQKKTNTENKLPDDAQIWKLFKDVALKYERQLEKSNGAHLAPAYRANGWPFQAKIPWHSPCYFDMADSAWQVIYSIDNRPVMIEHPFGDGTVILLTDTFLLSNEALRNERHPRFLTWLMGSNSQAVFDEAHLGMRKKPGVVALARQNRLHWPIGGIILLALLFIWKNAMPLTPPPQESDLQSDSSTSYAQDYTQGLISLLDRHIDKQKIMRIYVKQWRQALPRNQVLTDAQSKRIEAMFGEDGALIKGTNPVAAYRQIYTIISEE